MVNVVMKEVLLFYLCLIICTLTQCLDVNDVIYAVNAGGDVHVDKNGIRYEKDPLEVGTASDYGKQLFIGRVDVHDQVLYQTERYSHNTFGYDIPVTEDGNYVMVFDIVLNGDIVIVPELDIFDKVGRGVGHDEYIPFTISKGRLFCNEEESDIRGGKIRVEFIKGFRDNPKVNAILVVKGKLEDVPKLPQLELEDEDVSEEVHKHSSTKRRPSGPRTPNPYTYENQLLLPIILTITAVVPIVYCVCRL
ncbi:hypothetical protein M8J75_001078 [Diaphorina citri]|nr:hypothetical protein M8J75_001078 [Diaphorina citri]